MSGIPSTDHYETVFRTDLPLPERREGKVRDLYAMPDGTGRGVLIVATDRVSAFDVVLPTPIPGKGRLLNSISVKWFEWLRQQGILADHGLSDHLLSTDAADVPCLNEQQRRQIDGRIMIGRAAKVVPIECVVRGYLAGSGWIEYQRHSSVCGVHLPDSLQQSDRLPEPIFTPATKASVGHDENITFEQACDVVGRDLMATLRDVSIAIYTAAAAYAEQRGILLVDTKFEFGFALNEHGQPTDNLMLIDEILTPDSSRFWPAEDYVPGRDQQSFDKQYIRNYLLSLVDAGTWHKSPPGPELPDTIVSNTQARYAEALHRLFN